MNSCHTSLNFDELSVISSNLDFVVVAAFDFLFKINFSEMEIDAVPGFGFGEDDRLKAV